MARFGLPEFRGVRRGTPDITKREVGLILSTLKSVGVKVTVGSDIEKALAVAQKIVAEANKTLEVAKSQLKTIEPETEKLIKEVEKENQRVVGVIQAVAERTTGRVKDKAKKKIDKIEAESDVKVAVIEDRAMS